MIQHTEMPLVSEAEMAQFARAIGSDLFGEPEGPTLQSEETSLTEKWEHGLAIVAREIIAKHGYEKIQSSFFKTASACFGNFAHGVNESTTAEALQLCIGEFLLLCSETDMGSELVEQLWNKYRCDQTLLYLPKLIAKQLTAADPDGAITPLLLRLLCPYTFQWGINCSEQKLKASVVPKLVSEVDAVLPDEHPMRKVFGQIGSAFVYVAEFCDEIGEDLRPARQADERAQSQ